MPLPSFTKTGDLPVGIHSASLHEILERFSKETTKRKALALRLERVYRLALETGEFARFIVFGSFVSDKPEPNDVDVFILMGILLMWVSLLAKTEFFLIMQPLNLNCEENLMVGH